MIINKAALDGLFRNLRAEFQAAYGEAATIWMDIATRLSSSTGREDYRWFSRFPQMRKWVGDRTIKALAAHGYNVPNIDFEATIAVDRNDLEDDILGLYGAQAQGAGISAKLWPEELVLAAVNRGFMVSYKDENDVRINNRCHDGKAFFATDHPLDDANAFSNKLTKALSAANLADAQASLGAAITALQEMNDNEGRPMGCMPTVLLVPPALRDTANVLMMADRLPGDAPNPYKGLAKTIVSPRLTSATAWFLLDTMKPLRPFIFQERKMPQLVSLMDPTDESVFMRREYLFGVDARGAAAYGLPQTAVGSDGTT